MFCISSWPKLDTLFFFRELFHSDFKMFYLPIVSLSLTNSFSDPLFSYTCGMNFIWFFAMSLESTCSWTLTQLCIQWNTLGIALWDWDSGSFCKILILKLWYPNPSDFYNHVSNIGLPTWCWGKTDCWWQVCEELCQCPHCTKETQAVGLLGCVSGLLLWVAVDFPRAP